MAEGSAPVKGHYRTDLDGMEWIEGPGGRFAAFPLGDAADGPVVVIVEYAPDTVIGPHHHRSDYFSLVLRGQIEITRRREEAGSVRHVRSTTVYGPLVVGPEGATVLEVFEDRRTFVEPVFTNGSARTAIAEPDRPNPMPELFAMALAQAWTHVGRGRAEPPA